MNPHNRYYVSHSVGYLHTLSTMWACNVVGNSHIYTDDLITLQNTGSPPTGREVPIPPMPMYTQKLDLHLSNHPDSHIAGSSGEVSPRDFVLDPQSQQKLPISSSMARLSPNTLKANYYK